MKTKHVRGTESIFDPPSGDRLTLRLDDTGFCDISEYLPFCDRPAQYIWKYVGRQKILVPDHRDPSHLRNLMRNTKLTLGDLTNLPWTIRHVLILEGNIRPGEQHSVARRRFYLDSSSRSILFGDGYHGNGTVLECYIPLKGIEPVTGDSWESPSPSTPEKPARARVLH